MESSKPHTISLDVSKTAHTTRIVIGNNILRPELEALLSKQFSKVVVVADRIVETYMHSIIESGFLSPSALFYLDGGERIKELSCTEKLWNFFADQHVDKKSLVIGIGGGSITDTVGFAASTFMRGVAQAFVPTTLLAQVDAGIGGKNGINYRNVKNLIGSTQHPVAIISDIKHLEHLPQRELLSGFAEVVKHGLIANANYFEHVTSKPYSEWNKRELMEIIRESCVIKADIVSSDGTESYQRKALNFGHTLGHAIESLFLNKPTILTHGEAVSIGMIAASWISFRLGRISEEVHHTIERGIKAAGLPLSLPETCDPEQLLKKARADKKNIGGQIQWTLLNAIGTVAVNCTVADDIVLETIAKLQP